MRKGRAGGIRGKEESFSKREEEGDREDYIKRVPLRIINRYLA